MEPKEVAGLHIWLYPSSWLHFGQGPHLHFHQVARSLAQLYPQASRPNIRVTHNLVKQLRHPGLPWLQPAASKGLDNIPCWKHHSNR